jgi:hypothetical protein
MRAIYGHSHIGSAITIRRTHYLPPGGTARVSTREEVRAQASIGAVERPSALYAVNVAEELGIETKHVPEMMIKLEGDPVEEGEQIAVRRSLIGRKTVVSPAPGRLAKVRGGLAIIEGEISRTEIVAPLSGIVADVEARDYVTIDTKGAVIQLPWSRGKSVWGPLMLAHREIDTAFDPKTLSLEHQGAIIAIATALNEDILRRAASSGVKAVIGSALHASLMPRLGDLEITLGVTEGFGAQPMTESILGLLTTFSGRECGLDIRQPYEHADKPGLLVIPDRDQRDAQAAKVVSHEFSEGQRVRAWQQPHRGEIGTISSLPSEQYSLPNGLWIDGAMVKFSGEHPETAFVAFLNLEQLD